MSILDDSVLTTIRTMLGPEEDYKDFDPEIIPHINSAFQRLKQLGVGPTSNFRIEDEDATWGDFFGDEESVQDMVVPFIFLKVKTLFDPPTSSIASEAYKSEIDKLEWLMNVDAETDWEVS